MLGIDIVYLPEFQEKLKNLPMDKVFLESELSENKTLESLAGIFAAKEAFFKAIGKKVDWREVWIEKTKLGQPKLFSVLIKKNQNSEVSIAHSQDYAIAIVSIEE